MIEPNDVKATWREGSITVVMREPKSRPCNRSCPWRVANHGKRKQYTYDHEVAGIPSAPTCNYTVANYERAWTALRHGRPGTRPTTPAATGQPTLCHVARAGTADLRLVACQCTGALVLQQRELLRHVENGNSALTAQGAALVAADMLGRDVTAADLPLIETRELLGRAHPSLLDPQIGSPLIPALSSDEIARWSAGEAAGNPTRKAAA